MNRLNRGSKKASKQDMLVAQVTEVLEAAASSEIRGLARHFKARGKKSKDGSRMGGWPIDYTHVVYDVFYTAFGRHLESYLWPKLLRKGYYLYMQDGRLLISDRPLKADKTSGKSTLMLLLQPKRQRKSTNQQRKS
jgi:hypothetical protein